MKHWMFKGIILVLIAIVAASCSSEKKLEKLGYDQDSITEAVEGNYEKVITENKVQYEDYQKIINSPYYDEANINHYLRLLYHTFDVEELDKLVAGVNLIHRSADSSTPGSKSYNEWRNEIDSTLKPTLELKATEVQASMQGDSKQAIQNILQAKSVFDGDLIKQAIITTDMKLETPGEYDVKVEVQDSKGYSAVLEEQVHVVDNMPPSIEAPGSIEIFMGEALDMLAGVKVEDNLDGDMTAAVTMDMGDFTSDKAGQYRIVYKAVDKSGNEGVHPVTVTVLPVVKLNESFEVNKYTINVKSCSYNRTDSEPVDYFYQYYNADENQTFLICKVQIKNEHDIQRSPFEIFGDDKQKLRAELIYDGNYTYGDVAHGLENNWYDTFMSLKPLTSSTKNLTFEVPMEVKESGKSVVLQFSSYSTSDDTVNLKLK
ncbi:DUF5011 domain-containing protein [Paenibacillus sp. J5C_2022]|uniref:DUF5011 domain-containing protein n=1 Tax=Paenibacillus sp. J5C2022 TaxID=2977129 RepID=UPI0021D1EB9D|nr:DUF5011 domain-containing protein [Paenibacillus sp. J5C2022]MCU6712262.1 DUF5011 domain-containing protein [Paenibacillus sp. J5C2022]